VRLVFWFALLLSWIVLLPVLWSAFSTVPSAERLSQSHMVEIPTLGTVVMLVGKSAAELVVVLALTLPWWRRRYLTRLWLAAVGAWAWFFASTPMGLTRMAWMHRRWLAGVAAALLVAAVVGAMGRVVAGSGAGSA
jgi:hypothetical protein